MDGAEVELTLPARPGLLALARVIIGNVAAVGPSLQESRLADLRLIVSEVCTNAMEANWRAATDRLRDGADGATQPSHADVIAEAAPIVVTCRVALHEVALSVSDNGGGFQLDEAPHPPVQDPTRLEFERGLGIPLVQFLSDEVVYETSPDGTTVRIIVRDVRDEVGAL